MSFDSHACPIVTTMKLAITGFVSERAGSIASAHALLVRQLLEEGHKIDFFSKMTFVDPRPSIGEHDGFQFIDVTNTGPDRFRRNVQHVPGLGFAAIRFDVFTYNRLLVRAIARAHLKRRYDICLWLGEFARGRVPGLLNVSYLQGAPGSDARSVLDRAAEIQNLAGLVVALRWYLLARLRLSRFGLPPFQHSDHWIVGSSVSRETMCNTYRIPEDRISILAYPIDLQLFQHIEVSPQRAIDALRALWLGRIIPRKRLDLFLDGAALAIEGGLDLHLTIAGGIGFMPGYEKLISNFPYPGRLVWKQSVPREDVPRLISEHDVLVQPSDEEDFGHSVAEAQACGLPVIVGNTNGNRDYLCARDIHLGDDKPSTLAEALRTVAKRKAEGRLRDINESRELAKKLFDIKSVGIRLTEVLEAAALKVGISTIQQ